MKLSHSTLNLWIRVILITSVCSLDPSSFHLGHAEKGREDQDRSADQACGRDRRCRLARLRVLGQSKRQDETRLITQRAQEQADLISRRAQLNVPREAFPWGLDLISSVNSEFGSFGIAGAWQWLEHLQLWGGVSVCNLDTYDPKRSFYGYDAGLYAQLGTRYLFSRKDLSTYLGAQIGYIQQDGEMSGNSDGGSFFDFGFDGSGYNFETGELEAHLIGLSAGADYQSRDRFRLRLGVTMNYVLFASHRDINTRANLSTRSIAPAVVDQALGVVLDLAIGYAF